jgi:hypothetical protein
MIWTDVMDGNNWGVAWPRAAAVAERLWSSAGPAAEAATGTLLRLNDFSCRAAIRGLPTGPVTHNTFCVGSTSPADFVPPAPPPPTLRFIEYGQYRLVHVALVGLFSGMLGLVIGLVSLYCYNSYSLKWEQQRARSRRRRLADAEE